MCGSFAENDPAEELGMAQLNENIRMVKSSGLSAQQVAAIGGTAMQRGTPVVIPGFGNWRLAFSVRFLPRSLVTRLGKQMMEPVEN